MLSGALDVNVTIGLAHGEVFDRLAAVFSPLYIPVSVRQEVVGAGAAELARAAGVWLQEVSPSAAAARPFAHLRSSADRDVLAVAIEQRVDHVLSGDRVVRREAIAHGIACLAAAEVVVLFQRTGWSRPFDRSST